jgi:hypothetical protein
LKAQNMNLILNSFYNIMRLINANFINELMIIVCLYSLLNPKNYKVSQKIKTLKILTYTKFQSLYVGNKQHHLGLTLNNMSKIK